MHFCHILHILLKYMYINNLLYIDSVKSCRHTNIHPYLRKGEIRETETEGGREGG